MADKEPPKPDYEKPYNAGQYAQAKKYLEGLASTKHKSKQLSPANIKEMQDYLERTRLTHESLSNAREAKAAEQRKIQEKQIRGLRNTYRPAGGFLAQNANKLGVSNEGGLTNKLGE